MSERTLSIKLPMGLKKLDMVAGGCFGRRPPTSGGVPGGSDEDETSRWSGVHAAAASVELLVLSSASSASRRVPALPPSQYRWRVALTQAADHDGAQRHER